MSGDITVSSPTATASSLTETNDGRPGGGSRTVALYVTCLADLMRPEVAEAAVTLLEAADCEVIVPRAQSCCGQPGYNSGDYTSAAAIARQVIAEFEKYEYVVLPSGSCAGMLTQHYPKLLEGRWRERACALAERVYELTQFLVEVCNYVPPRRGKALKLSYHDSCAGLRELGIRAQPRQLLAAAGVEIRELAQRDVCCGFGGTFCAKMPGISAKMADDKLQDASASGAALVCGGDLGCLLALAGRARRAGSPLQFRHIAEVLVANDTTATIGEGKSR